LVVDSESESVLLIQRTNPPAVGSWSVPAGFLEFDEPPRQAAVRELHEETNLTVAPDSLSLAGTTFLEYTDGQFVLVVVYTVSHAQTDGELKAGSDAGDARFWEYESLTQDAPLEPGIETSVDR
jgi:ADP-ribose pyrophosphatase YjhB (NUDIX family)